MCSEDCLSQFFCSRLSDLRPISFPSGKLFYKKKKKMWTLLKFRKHFWHVILQFSLKLASLGYGVGVFDKMCCFGHSGPCVSWVIFPVPWSIGILLGCDDHVYAYPTVHFTAGPLNHPLAKGATLVVLCGGLTVSCLCSLEPLGKWIGLTLNPSSLCCACLCMTNFLKMFEK